MRTRTIVSVASLVGLSLAGAAEGAPPVGGGGTTPPGQGGTELPHVVVHYGVGLDPRLDASFTCSTAPTIALCNNPGYQACSNQQGPCQALAQSASASYAATGTQTCLMDATGDHCIPSSVKKYATAYKTNDGTSWQAQEAGAMRNARVALDNASRGFDASTYTRNAKWSSRTSRVDSCESYVYSKYYDYERFLDASYACGTNDQCVFDAAFKDYANAAAGAPRIAKRALLDREGAPLTSRSWSEVADARFELNASDLLPKNPFYASAAFMPPAVFDALFAAWAADPAMVAKLHTLQTQLAKGYNFYTYGSYGQPAVESYPTVWDWHLAMSNRTKPKAYAPAQQVEFQRRNEIIKASVWTLASSLACSNLSIDCAVVPFQVARVTPGMAESYPSDPFAVAGMLTKNDRLSAALQGAFQSTFSPSEMPAAFLDINVGQIGAPGFHSAGMKSVPGAVPGAPMPTVPRGGAMSPVVPAGQVWNGFPADYWTAIKYGNQNQLQAASRVLQNHWKPGAAVVDPARGAGAHPRLDCNAPGVLDDGVLMAACETTNIVLDEWARGLAGNESCLDMNGYACDWSPLEFRESVIGAQRLQHSREIDYQECLQNTQNSFATVAGGGGTVSYGQQATWKTVQVRIAEIIAALAAFNRAVPRIDHSAADPNDPFKQTLGTVYGDRAKDVQQWGNDTFGAGYSYDIGWDAAVLDRAKDAQNKPTGVITQMQLDFDGDFEAHANAFGKSISLLEAQLGARINDGNLGTVDAAHYLYIIGFGSFDGLEHKGFTKVADINQSFQLANPTDKFDKNVFDAGFWVGPVYVHVGIDVEFFYGAPLEGKVEMPFGHAALAPQPGKLLSGTLTFHPRAGVNADLYAYGGWGPIAEVGVEAQLNLITVGLPMTSSIALVARKSPSNQDVLFLTVKEGIDVSIETLSGEIDLCGKILGFGGCTKVLSWRGLHQQFPLFTAVDEEVELAALH